VRRRRRARHLTIDLYAADGNGLLYEPVEMLSSVEAENEFVEVVVQVLLSHVPWWVPISQRLNNDAIPCPGSTCASGAMRQYVARRKQELGLVNRETDRLAFTSRSTHSKYAGLRGAVQASLS
jgi:hypothetical protein